MDRRRGSPGSTLGATATSRWRAVKAGASARSTPPRTATPSSPPDGVGSSSTSTPTPRSSSTMHGHRGRSTTRSSRTHPTSSWAAPDLDHAVELLREVVADPEQARARGRTGARPGARAVRPRAGGAGVPGDRGPLTSADRRRRLQHAGGEEAVDLVVVVARAAPGRSAACARRGRARAGCRGRPSARRGTPARRARAARPRAGRSRPRSPRATYCASVVISAPVSIGAAGTPCAWQAAATASFDWAAVHSPMRSSISSARARRPSDVGQRGVGGPRRMSPSPRPAPASRCRPGT